MILLCLNILYSAPSLADRLSRRVGLSVCVSPPSRALWLPVQYIIPAQGSLDWTSCNLIEDSGALSIGLKLKTCLGVFLSTNGLSHTQLYSVESFYISDVLEHCFPLNILRDFLPSAC